jgi:hypothetical protein
MASSSQAAAFRPRKADEDVALCDFPSLRRRNFFPEKYNRSTMENARQLQCKPLQGLEKIRRRKNNGEQWKEQ